MPTAAQTLPHVVPSGSDDEGKFARHRDLSAMTVVDQTAPKPFFVVAAIATLICLIVVGTAWWILKPETEPSKIADAQPLASPSPVGEASPILQSPVGAAAEQAAAPPIAIAPPAPPPAVPPADQNASLKQNSANDVVRAFYLALSRGDGAAAASFLAPERQTGALSARAMTHFYSTLIEPLQLISVSPVGQNDYEATYAYRANVKTACTGSATVTVTERKGRFLIQKIDAHGGC